MAVETLPAALARIKASENKFYVYILRRLDGEPFYVGKGHSRRISRHEEEARTAHRSHKASIIRGIWRAGAEPLYEVVGFYAAEEEAFAEEIRLIAQIGRRDLACGPLANVTDGGDGMAGHVWSARAREKMAIAVARRWTDAEYRAAMVAVSKRQWEKPEHRAAMAASSRLRANRPESKARLSAELKRRWEDPEYRDAMNAVVARRWDRPGERERQSATRKRYLETPGVRAAISATGRVAQKRLLEQPGARERKSAASVAAMKIRWAKPGERERHSERNRVMNARRRQLKEQGSRGTG